MSAVRSFVGSRGKGGKIRPAVDICHLTARGIIPGRPRQPEEVG